jgi:hypothetical protein
MDHRGTLLLGLTIKTMEGGAGGGAFRAKATRSISPIPPKGVETQGRRRLQAAMLSLPDSTPSVFDTASSGLKLAIGVYSQNRCVVKGMFRYVSTLPCTGGVSPVGRF